MKFIIAIILSLFLSIPARADDYTYTNKDLEHYQQTPKENKKGKIQIIPKKRTIVLYLAECPTLQDNINKTNTVKTGTATITLRTKGRTLQEICKTVGNGCNICKELR